MHHTQHTLANVLSWCVYRCGCTIIISTGAFRPMPTAQELKVYKVSVCAFL